MARADLHRALVVDREIHLASQIDPTLLDPVIKIDTLPGVARPFVVSRAYQGPQGYYIEQFVLTDKDGVERYRSTRRRVALRGEMFEDEVSNTVSGVEIRNGREHLLTCFIDGDELGSVPVFVETSAGGDVRVAVEETFKQAVKKGTILWVTVPPRPNGRRGPAAPITRPAWFVADGTKVMVLSGPTEQEFPGIADVPQVSISARSKDHRSLVTEVAADVEVVPPDDPRYDKFVKKALTTRLNLPDGDAAADRWRQKCVLVELTPRFRDVDEDEAERQLTGVATAAQAPGQAAAPAAAGSGSQEEEIHVEAQVDQEVYDRLIGEGKSERVARAQAKAAYVRAEKKRIRAEREAAAG
jgi:hypothetical protein